jgi:fructose-1,6-bisphosphatase/inositol monophosphatase family enzyme
MAGVKFDPLLGQLRTTDSGGGSGITRSIASVSTATTAGATAVTDYVYLVSGITTLTLPTAVSNLNKYTVKNTGSNAVTVATTSSQQIDGTTTITLNPLDSVDLISNGTNWYII